jgi:hypothetical protein
MCDVLLSTYILRGKSVLNWKSDAFCLTVTTGITIGSNYFKEVKQCQDHAQ